MFTCKLVTKLRKYVFKHVFCYKPCKIAVQVYNKVYCKQYVYKELTILAKHVYPKNVYGHRILVKNQNVKPIA